MQRAIIKHVIIMFSESLSIKHESYIIIGEAGLGKTTLIDSLFNSHTYASKTALTVQGELEIYL